MEDEGGFIMSLFNKKEKVLQQDVSNVEGHPGMVFIIHLLMEEMCEMTDKQFMLDVMNKHLGETDCFCHNGKVAGFAPKKYKIHFEKENRDISPQLMIMQCIKNEKPVMDEIAETQLWNCQNGDEILNKCSYQVFATDMMAANLDYKERAEMLVDYVEALVEMYPTCKAVVFEKHIGIVSDKRNKKGIPYVIHHANPYQLNYEEDFLEYRDDIVGHYRIT